MIRLVVYSIALLFTILASAQVSENRTVSNFSKIKVSAGIDLVFTQESKTSLKVEADDAEKLQDIMTIISGNTLEIYVDSKNFNKKGKKNKNRYTHKTLKVWVSAPAVDSFKASSSSSVSLKNGIDVPTAEIKVSSSASLNGNIKAEEITIEVSASGNLKSNISAKKISADLSSSGDALLSGNADSITISASSSADLKAKDLTVRNANIDASSSAEVVLNVTESLTAKASSSGSVSYYGNPKNVQADKSSSGSVTKK
jgi:hypothetical protein